MSLKFTITYLAAVTNRSSVDRLFGAAVNYIEALLNIESSFLFDVSIVTSKYMQSINKKYRQINKPTDVLSFVFLDGEPKTNLLGEIFIN
jgi:ssRNA-specific RNase YbeY (16S rRNA maturation enzyme)